MVYNNEELIEGVIPDRNYRPTDYGKSHADRDGLKASLWNWFRQTYLGRVWVLSGLFVSLRQNKIDVYDIYAIGDNGVNIHIGEDFINKLQKPKRNNNLWNELKRIFGGLPAGDYSDDETNNAITLYNQKSDLLVDIDPIEKFVRDLFKSKNPHSEIETIGDGGNNTRWITVWNVA